MKGLKILLPVLVLALVLTGCGQKAGNLTLDTQSVTLNKAGATKTLNVTVQDTKGNTIAEPKQPITWSSSNPAVATVSNEGLVTAVGSGSTVVTASMGDLSASATVNVQIVASVTIMPSSKTIDAGKTVSFKVVVKDEKGNSLTNVPVSWSTANNTIASVAGGKVTGKLEGTTTVKAVAQDKSGLASVTVKGADLVKGLKKKEGSDKGDLKKGKKEKKLLKKKLNKK